MYSGGCDKQAKMWPVLSGGQAVVVGMHDAPIKSISWITEMNLLVTGSWDKTVKYVRNMEPLISQGDRIIVVGFQEIVKHELD